MNIVTRFSNCDPAPLARLLSRFGLTIKTEPAGQPIPGSFWGDEEAGLIGDTLIVRQDTPLHSVMHETCHYICMDDERRSSVDTNAGGGYDEENAVCYLQILLADEIAGFDQGQMMKEMDDWGYTFRLGSARAWFEQDAGDARDWLLRNGLITAAGKPTFSIRTG